MVPAPFFRSAQAAGRDDPAPSLTLLKSEEFALVTRKSKTSLKRCSSHSGNFSPGILSPLPQHWQSFTNTSSDTSQRDRDVWRDRRRGSSTGPPRPSLRKSATALSSFSVKSARSEATSSIPPDVEAGLGLRPRFSVNVSCEAAVRDVYQFTEQLGQGGFGQVWLCRHRLHKVSYAAKIMHLKTIGDVDRFEGELKVFERLRSPYIVALHAVFREDEHLYLVMDLCTGGDLRQFLINYSRVRSADHSLQHRGVHQGLPWELVARFLWQMLAGIAYMHHHRFMHRDVKLSNFVLKEPKEGSVLQLVDFGLSTTFKRGEKATVVCGTVTYMAPEVLQQSYNEMCDIWSIGISSYILCLDRSPWPHNADPHRVQDLIQGYLLRPWPVGCPVPRELRDLINSFLARDPEDRPSAKDVIATSSWLREHGRPRASKDLACCAVC